MQDPSALVAVAGTAVAGLGLTSAAALKGWREWLDVRRLEAGAGRAGPSPAPRVEVADLRERVRRLEAIADGAPY